MKPGTLTRVWQIPRPIGLVALALGVFLAFTASASARVLRVAQIRESDSTADQCMRAETSDSADAARLRRKNIRRAHAASMQFESK